MRTGLAYVPVIFEYQTSESTLTATHSECRLQNPNDPSHRGAKSSKVLEILKNKRCALLILITCQDRDNYNNKRDDVDEQCQLRDLVEYLGSPHIDKGSDPCYGIGNEYSVPSLNLVGRIDEIGLAENEIGTNEAIRGTHRQDT
jgi:hypothetical protein